MHTIKKYDDDWCVGVLERGEHGVDEFVIMFAGMNIMSAVRLTSMLNGGGYIETGLSNSNMEALWRHAHKEENNGR